MIRTENLTRIFRTEEIETIALNGVNINVKDGEFVAIMGPSGCGKSTLLNILGLLDTPTEGKYWLGDEEVGHLKERERTAYRKGRIGFVFQNFNLIDELTVEENIDLQLKYLGIGKAERKERVLDILRKVKLSHRAKHYPHQLSGGQQQRVAIARARAELLLDTLIDKHIGIHGSTQRQDHTGYMIRAPTFRRSTQRQEPHPLQLNTAAPQNLRSAGTAAFTRGRFFCAAAYADRLLSACRTAADAAERIYLWHFSIAQ
jgi:ABC-type lipoprotein export system ATPase subunit